MDPFSISALVAETHEKLVKANFNKCMREHNTATKADIEKSYRLLHVAKASLSGIQ